MMGFLLTAALSTVTAQNFSDRVAMITLRITSAASTHAIAPSQQTLIQAELATAKNANGRNDPQAGAMLDDIERQLTPIDHLLTRANDGGSLVVHQGDQLVVGLHDQHIYDIHLSKRGVIAIRPGIMVVRGIQGIYIAKMPGVIQMTIEPRPGVTPSPPPSMQTPLHFTIVVLPKPQAP